MRYLFLAYRDEQQWNAMSAGEREALARACRESDEALGSSGHLLAAAALAGSCASTVRVHRGALALADGPVAPAREQLSAIFTISARDLNEAIRLAAAMPHARAGPIEVRPLSAPDAPPA